MTWVNVVAFFIGLLVGRLALLALLRWLEVRKFEKDMRLKQSQQAADTIGTAKYREMFPNVPEDLELEWTTKETKS